jgi:hypothetical protein
VTDPALETVLREYPAAAANCSWMYPAAFRASVLRAAKVTEPPLLVVEVQSPSTALIDLNVKKAAYERFGIDAYWIVVPDPAGPSLTAFELTDGRYELAAKVTGDDVFSAQRPFAVEVRPSDLVARLRRAEPPPDQAT